MRVSFALLLVASCSAFQLAPSAARTPPLASTVRCGDAVAQMPQAALQLVTLIGRAPEEISFQLTMDAIEELYDVTPKPFSVGDVVSAPGQNGGSAKIFSFGAISKLDEQATLHCFGDYYRVDVLQNPNGDDHANIRAFMKGGWACVNFPEGLALEPKASLS